VGVTVVAVAEILERRRAEGLDVSTAVDLVMVAAVVDDSRIVVFGCGGAGANDGMGDGGGGGDDGGGERATIRRFRPFLLPRRLPPPRAPADERVVSVIQLEQMAWSASCVSYSAMRIDTC
jgi:hypothetical protein